MIKYPECYSKTVDSKEFGWDKTEGKLRITAAPSPDGKEVRVIVNLLGREEPGKTFILDTIYVDLPVKE